MQNRNCLPSVMGNKFSMLLLIIDKALNDLMKLFKQCQMISSCFSWDLHYCSLTIWADWKAGAKKGVNLWSICNLQILLIWSKLWMYANYLTSLNTNFLTYKKIYEIILLYLRYNRSKSIHIIAMLWRLHKIIYVLHIWQRWIIILYQDYHTQFSLKVHCKAQIISVGIPTMKRTSSGL